MCKLFNVSRSCYYVFIKANDCERKTRNRNLLEQIKICYNDSKGTYGSPRLTVALRDKGIKVSEVTVARIMKKNKIKSVTSKKFVVTTDSNHKYPISENLLNREFMVNEPSKAWVSDITYIRTQEGWLYLTTIIDLFDRKVIGRSISDNLDAYSTVIIAFKDALNNRTMHPDTIFHSDRGVQYASEEFRLVLKKYSQLQSMSRKGNCWDNAVAESFFSSFKKECIRKTVFYSKDVAKKETFSYIDDWYNAKRKHSYLGYISPLEFEIIFRTKNVA